MSFPYVTSLRPLITECWVFPGVFLHFCKCRLTLVVVALDYESRLQRVRYLKAEHIIGVVITLIRVILPKNYGLHFAY